MIKTREKWKRRILYILFVVGALVFLYPSFSNYWNEKHQSEAILNYKETINLLDDEEYQKIMADAKRYNELLFESYKGNETDDADLPPYESILNVSGTGMMGYIEIPKINVNLPIYHGSSDSVLQNNAGHFAVSSLPIGGLNTHSVITGHRGLASAKLFTDLDLIHEGDLFFVDILGTKLAYKVDNISVVLPYETETVAIEEGKDYCTLATCTPYGVNSHRLLVRGTRVPYSSDDEMAQEKAMSLRTQIDPFYIISSLILIMIIILVIAGRKKKKKK